MFSMAFASVLLALFATAGAISIVRSLSRRSASKRDETPGVVVPERPAVGGLGILFGVLITLFYVNADVPGARALLVAGAVLSVIATGSRRWFTRSQSSVSLSDLTAGAVAVGAVLLFVGTFAKPDSSAGTVLVLMTLLTPAAVPVLLRSSAASNAVPIGIVLIQLLLLLAFVGLALEGGVVAALPSDVLNVALPLIGALLGALLYIWPMPWRGSAAISTGAATCLGLGLIVAWATARVGFGWLAPEHGFAAYLPWVLAVPVFEWLRWHVALAILRLSPAHGVPGAPPTSGASEHPRVPPGFYPAWSLYLFAIVLGCAGIALWLSNSPAWSVWGLIPAWLAYCMTPLLLRPTSGETASRTADA